ncbi:uncharacterized protein F5147DRAFT_722372 [Suillus discolor]|uniref:Uncharacterized protein n=1 Tax=Suillus discolor TaxID=1912936 RepID=A0A9P7JN30_9AGAM|nr:uncharacterized protein F5147DRAFT_722372 [Suillus discolor]KAG2092525.1 hypothetical protein F5147DRAFT_722372 [Suillus discolor]
MRMPRFLFGDAATLSLRRCRHATSYLLPLIKLPLTKLPRATLPLAELPFLSCSLFPHLIASLFSSYDCGDRRLPSLRRIHSYFLGIRSPPRLTLAQVWAAIGAGCPSRGSAQIAICIQSMQTFSLTLSPKLLPDSPHKVHKFSKISPTFTNYMN